MLTSLYHLGRNTVMVLLATPRHERPIVAAAVVVFAIFGTYVHELGHLIVGHCFGMVGRIRLFPRIGDRKTWKGSILCCDFGDSHASVSSGRKRLVAAAGPLVQIALAWYCLRYGWNVAGPDWLWRGLIGAVLATLLTSPANVLPIRWAGNDGWKVIRPD